MWLKLTAWGIRHGKLCRQMTEHGLLWFMWSQACSTATVQVQFQAYSAVCRSRALLGDHGSPTCSAPTFINNCLLPNRAPRVQNLHVPAAQL